MLVTTTSMESAFSSQVNYFGVARQPGAIAITSLQADFRVPFYREAVSGFSLSHLCFFSPRAGFVRTNGWKMSSTNSVMTALGTGFKVIRTSCRNRSGSSDAIRLFFQPSFCSRHFTVR